MNAAIDEKLLTVEEYCQLPDHDFPTELVRGRIVKHRFPGFRHGLVCGHVIGTVGRYLDQRDIGHAVCNTGIVTTRDPEYGTRSGLFLLQLPTIAGRRVSGWISRKAAGTGDRSALARRSLDDCVDKNGGILVRRRKFCDHPESRIRIRTRFRC